MHARGSVGILSRPERAVAPPWISCLSTFRRVSCFLCVDVISSPHDLVMLVVVNASPSSAKSGNRLTRRIRQRPSTNLPLHRRLERMQAGKQATAHHLAAPLAMLDSAARELREWPGGTGEAAPTLAHRLRITAHSIRAMGGGADESLLPASEFEGMAPSRE
jgi:hypothetical protein